MEPKLKATELVEKFIGYARQDKNKDGHMSGIENAKQCALILCNEMISQTDFDWRKQYWQQVRIEIEKL